MLITVCNIIQFPIGCLNMANAQVAYLLANDITLRLLHKEDLVEVTFKLCSTPLSTYDTVTGELNRPYFYLETDVHLNGKKVSLDGYSLAIFLRLLHVRPMELWIVNSAVSDPEVCHPNTGLYKAVGRFIYMLVHE